jgi:geranylgeranyl pyrophosphate synthase
MDKHIEKFLPKEYNENWFKENIGDNNLNAKVYDALSAPIWDLLTRGGKRWRPVFMIVCCNAFKGSKKIYDLIPLIELLHNATLIIDDIEDLSHFRRGKPCIHKKFGIDRAINSSNFVYFLPYLIIKKSGVDERIKSKVSEVVSEEMLKLHIGQGMDISWHNNGHTANKETYFQMCAFKTGTLVRLAAKLGALIGNATKKQMIALSRFAESIGIAFQIQDDILNITTKNLGKELGDDITEGKQSLMVIRTIEIANKRDKKRLREILNLKTRNKKLIKESIKILEKYDSINYARKKAKAIVKSAWGGLDPLIKESEHKKKLKLFADFLINREV